MSESAAIENRQSDTLGVSHGLIPIVTWRQLSPWIVAFDILTILAVAIAGGSGYFWLAYDGTGHILDNLKLGFVTAVLFVTVTVIRGGYDFSAFTSRASAFRAVIGCWHLAFVLLALVLFLLKAGADVSRGLAAILYLGGLGALLLTRLCLVPAMAEASRARRLAARRIFLVGEKDDIESFILRFRSSRHAFALVGVATLDAGAAADPHRLKHAVEDARRTSPDDVLIVTPWVKEQLLAEVVEAFKSVPAAIEIAAPSIFDRFETVMVASTGRVRSLIVTPPPLDAFEQFAKRAIDVVIAGLGLVALAPAFLVIAILIKRDSPGPVFFRQRRHGFNQGEFEIYKFRSMTVTEDGVTSFVQAQKGDARVTRIGAFLRRTSLDELPQLINVLLGQMSIVGPRPHAIKHNKEFEDRIALYARRHNVKPGITGWAQVNGLRGDTSTEGKMRARIGCDLYYLDHWSLWLDIKIILMTVGALWRNKDVF